MNVKLLQRLTEAHGVSGQEDAIREIVREELKDICEISIDAMGNMICLRKATSPPKKGPTKKLMIAAHMDEIGFIVKFIDDKGFLRLQPLGGWDPRQMAIYTFNAVSTSSSIFFASPNSMRLFSL